MSHTVGPGDIVLLQPGHAVKWKFSPSGHSVLYTFAFGVAGIPSSWPPPHDWPFSRKMPAEDVLRPLFEFVVTHASESADEVPPAISLAIQTMMVAFVLGPVDLPHMESRSYPLPVLRVIHWVSECFTSCASAKVTLDDLAVIGGVSPKHLCRLFNQHVGCGPLEWVYLLRVTRSLIGLGAGKKIETLAHDLGFASAAHYTRRFRALFGKSPHAMQEAMAKGYRPKLPDLPLMG